MIDNDKISIAQQLVTRFFQGDFEAVVQSLDESIRQQFPVERLQATRLSLAAQVGEFKEQVGAHTFQMPTAELVIVTIAARNGIRFIISKLILAFFLFISENTAHIALILPVISLPQPLFTCKHDI